MQRQDSVSREGERCLVTLTYCLNIVFDQDGGSRDLVCPEIEWQAQKLTVVDDQQGARGIDPVLRILDSVRSRDFKYSR